MESGNGFTHRHRWAVALGAALAAIALLVVVYKASAPRSASTTASGDRIPESEVLQVGALPVT